MLRLWEVWDSLYCALVQAVIVNKVVDRPTRVSHSQLIQMRTASVEKHRFLFTQNTNKHRTIHIFKNTILTKEEIKNLT